MAFVSIKYNGINETLKYESVHLSTYDNKELIFNSGNFVKDWFDCIKYCCTELSESIRHSSVVDHFFFDGAEYDSAYLHIVNKIGELRYTYKDFKGY
jgi:hypothetical protein